jgi:hypothetical protein
MDDASFLLDRRKPDFSATTTIPDSKIKASA